MQPVQLVLDNSAMTVKLAHKSLHLILNGFVAHLLQKIQHGSKNNCWVDNEDCTPGRESKLEYCEQCCKLSDFSDAITSVFPFPLRSRAAQNLDRNG